MLILLNFLCVARMLLLAVYNESNHVGDVS